MKKLCFVLVILSSASITSAQIQKVSAGIMIPATATMSIPVQEKPFKTGLSVTPSFNVLMPRMHMHLMYDCTGNSVQSLVGYMFNGKYDAYLFGSKSLNSRNSYLGLGLEKAIIVNQNFVFVPFAEVDLKARSFTVGATAHPQLVLWKRK